MMHPLMSSETEAALRPQRRKGKKNCKVNKVNKEQVMDGKKSL